MKIEFLISTMNRKDDSFLVQMFKNIDISTVNAVVINQCSGKVPVEIFTEFRNVKIYSVNDIGLSKSRNLALQKSTGDICIISDDDVIYSKSIIYDVANTFINHPMDVATYKYQNSSAHESKKYSLKAFFHNMRTISRVSSIEVAFRRDSIFSNNIKFDENFGLGTELPTGEEYIFLGDCLKSRLSLKYFPITIVQHDGVTSTFSYSKELVVARGALLKRIYGFLVIFTIPYFAFKWSRFLEQKYFSILRFMILGFLKTNKIDG